MYVNELKLNQDTKYDDVKVYKCPKCKEFELRRERIGSSSNFESWTTTGNWICDNPDCGAEFRENNQGELKLQ